MRRTHGFSLVELSIVLVILGLLVGGVLGGQSLIRAAEIRKIINEHTAYVTAVNAFRERYRHLPGDFNIATRFWGEPSEDCDNVFGGKRIDEIDNTASYFNSFDGTCNGNGDGMVVGGIYYQTDWPLHEGIFFFHHLMKAGLLTPTMVSHGNAATYWIPSYIPETYMNESMSPGSSFFPALYGNRLVFYTLIYSSWDEALPTERAWQIDSKIDDGKPGTGTVSTFPEFVANSKCNLLPSGGQVNGTHAAIAEYDLASPNGTCIHLFFAY